MAMTGQSEWRGDQYTQGLRAGIERNLDAAAIYLQEKLKDAVRSGQPPSVPWMPPHRDTGHLMRNIGHDKPGPLSRRVGTGIGNAESVGYAMWLEFGTRKMLPRPWLRPVSYRERAALSRLVGKPVYVQM